MTELFHSFTYNKINKRIVIRGYIDILGGYYTIEAKLRQVTGTCWCCCVCETLLGFRDDILTCYDEEPVGYDSGKLFSSIDREISNIKFTDIQNEGRNVEYVSYDDFIKDKIIQKFLKVNVVYDIV